MSASQRLHVSPEQKAEILGILSQVKRSGEEILRFDPFVQKFINNSQLEWILDLEHQRIRIFDLEVQRDMVVAVKQANLTIGDENIFDFAIKNQKVYLGNNLSMTGLALTKKFEPQRCLLLIGAETSEHGLQVLKSMTKKYIQMKLKVAQQTRDSGKVKLFSLLKKSKISAGSEELTKNTSLESQSVLKQDSILTARVKISASNGDNTNLDIESVKIEEKLRLVTEENFSLKKSLKSMKVNTELLIKQNEELQSKIRDQEEEMQLLNKNSNVLHHEFASLLNGQKGQQYWQNQEIEKRLATITRDFQSRLATSKVAQQELEQEKLGFSIRIDELVQQVAQLEETNKKLREIINSKDEQFYNLSLELESLNNRCKDIQSVKQHLELQNASYIEANQRLVEEVKYRTNQVRSLRQHSTVFETQILQEENARRSSNIRASCDYQADCHLRATHSNFDSVPMGTIGLREHNPKLFDSISQRQSRCSTTSFVLPSRKLQSVRYPSTNPQGMSLFNNSVSSAWMQNSTDDQHQQARVRSELCNFQIQNSKFETHKQREESDLKSLVQILKRLTVEHSSQDKENHPENADFSEQELRNSKGYSKFSRSSIDQQILTNQHLLEKVIDKTKILFDQKTRSLKRKVDEGVDRNLKLRQIMTQSCVQIVSKDNFINPGNC